MTNIGMGALGDVARQIEQSSFGTAGAQSLRARTPQVITEVVLARVEGQAENTDTLSAVEADDPAAVVTAAATGDQAALRWLVQYIRPLVVRYCRARIGSPGRSFASADEVAQEVCAAVLAALASYRDQGRPFLAFVYGIAAHKVAEAHRAAARSPAESAAQRPDDPERSAGRPERWSPDLTTRMAKLFAVLPAKQREILVLRVVVGLSAEETAEAVGSTPGAVRVAQHRALNRLQKEKETAWLES